MSNRKAELLDAALHYLQEHGVADVSLRPLAAALGTSPRMLMFHFKSKEDLLQEVMVELNVRLGKSLETITTSSARPRGEPPLRAFWRWATKENNLPYLRLLYEAQIIAAQNPARYGFYLKKASCDWQKLALAAMSEPLRTSTLATVCIAVFDGLMLELMCTGDHARLTRALDVFIDLVTTGAAQKLSTA